MADTPPVDPGAIPTADRALAPDLARGGMLLLIALANVHLYLYGQPPGVRGYPRDVEGVDRAIAVAQMVLVDGRAYPLFGLLFGYGIVQLAWRRSAVGVPVGAVTRLVRRRGAGLIVIGLAHGVLLFSGDIVGAYGLLAVLMAGLVVRGSDTRLLVTAATGVAVVTLSSAAYGADPAGVEQALLPSIATIDPVEAMVSRAVEWATAGLVQAVAIFGPVALGGWAARRRVLDEPDRHRRLLARVAVTGIAAAVLGGLPLALMAAGLWTAPPPVAALLAGSLHAWGGIAGGIGYAGLFGLLAIRLIRLGRVGPITRAVRACGQRSLSCYLAQSVAFAALLPAWALGLGEDAHPWQTALVAVGAWVVIVVAAAVSDRVGYRGPAEVLLRRLTYGRRPARQTA